MNFPIIISIAVECLFRDTNSNNVTMPWSYYKWVQQYLDTTHLKLIPI